jgi:GcrA cell cycle regulator
MTQRADAGSMWNDEKIAKLRKLWQEGLTTGEIGKRLGVSKNAVVGKAHRLGLKGRPSPIKRQEAAATPAAPAAAPSSSPSAAHAPSAPAAAPVHAPSSSAKKNQPAKVFTLTDLTHNTCRWPIGDPKHEDFHFCGKQVYPGKPYCLDHCAQAYVGSNKPRNEEAA